MKTDRITDETLGKLIQQLVIQLTLDQEQAIPFELKTTVVHRG